MGKYTTISAVFYAIAKELAQKAKDSMPELRESEKIEKEWYENGVYYRQTVLDGKTYLCQYDFKHNKISFLVAG